jgi:hypothetical protein
MDAIGKLIPAKLEVQQLRLVMVTLAAVILLFTIRGKSRNMGMYLSILAILVLIAHYTNTVVYSPLEVNGFIGVIVSDVLAMLGHGNYLRMGTPLLLASDGVSILSLLAFGYSLFLEVKKVL